MAESRKAQPLSPMGRLFAQPLLDQIIISSVTFELPLDAEAFKNNLQNSIMTKHPRFCSLMVRDSCGREHWRKTQIDLDRHIFIRNQKLYSDDPSIADEDAINDFIADLTVSSPLSIDKPLWEIHVLVAHKTVVFRTHHALGDCGSLMSMLWSCFRRSDDPSIVAVELSAASEGRWCFWRLVLVIWYTVVYALDFCLRAVWRKDKTTALSGGAGLELWPRKIATARFRLDDMKTVKRIVGGATINDVLLAIISFGLSKYLDSISPKALPEGLQLTGVSMVNLRSGKGLQDVSELMNNNSENRWGNQIGAFLIPIYYNKSILNPLDLVMRNKEMMDKKKLSLEGPFSYGVNRFAMSIFGAKLASILFYRIGCNTSFFLSNNVGPHEAIKMMGNPIKYIRATSSAAPHAISMYLVSYAEFADLQILVAKDIIPNPKILAKYFEDALFVMKKDALKDDAAANT